jgi:hypothetical protein
MQRWLQLAEDVAVLQYPLGAFGIDFKRTVTLLRLHDGRLIIHSTAPFTREDVIAIERFGKPGWLIEATRFHDTYARDGRAGFPSLPYLTPADSNQPGGGTARPLTPPPDDWSGEVELLKLEGLRWQNEHAFYHRSSRTLVLADLLFHFSSETAGWRRFFVRHVMRLPQLVGISVFFRMMIADPRAFSRSARRLLEWDFQQIVVAHAEPIREKARGILEKALRDQDLLDNS